jgi:hypothetical protein
MTSYALTRFTVGIVAFLLPIVVLIWGLTLGDVPWFTDGISTAPSLSAYYYTPARNVFIGALWVVGVFMIFHRAETSTQTFWMALAGLTAILVASVPTGSPEGLPAAAGAGATSPVGPFIHTASASLFFLIMMIYIGFVFPNSGVRHARVHNILHRLSAGAIAIQLVILGLAGTPLYTLPKGATFWFEAGMLMFVGFAWQQEFVELLGWGSLRGAFRRVRSDWKAPAVTLYRAAVGTPNSSGRVEPPTDT